MKTLELYAEKLSALPNQQDVDAVIAEIGDTPQGAHEKAFPDWGTMKLLIEERSHPLSHFRSLIRTMARAFGERADPTLFAAFEATCGHRTDADLDAAFKIVMGSELKRMPTPGQFRSACPVLTVDRTGKKY